MLSITYFYREPRKTGVSIEGIFRLMRQCLSGAVEIREFYCDAGASRLQNTLRAAKAAGPINHITGDVNFLAFGLIGKKNVMTIHDLGHYDTLKEESFLKYTIYRLFWYKYPLRYMDIVTVVSEFTKQKLIAYFQYPEDRIRVITNPVKPIFRVAGKAHAAARQRVLMLGTGKHKNLDNLIAAAKGTDMELDIVGWPAQDELDKLKAYGIPHTIYNRLTDEQVYERYLACDVLFMASHYEGFGMPVIEAQAVGRPVVTSNIGAMKEVGEGSALLVRPDSAEEIRAAILSLKDKNVYDDVVARGLANAAKYDSDKIAAQYLDVYLELAGKKASR